VAGQEIIYYFFKYGKWERRREGTCRNDQRIERKNVERETEEILLLQLEQ